MERRKNGKPKHRFRISLRWSAQNLISFERKPNTHFISHYWQNDVLMYNVFFVNRFWQAHRNYSPTNNIIGTRWAKHVFEFKRKKIILEPIKCTGAVRFAITLKWIELQMFWFCNWIGANNKMEIKISEQKT